MMENGTAMHATLPVTPDRFGGMSSPMIPPGSGTLDYRVMDNEDGHSQMVVVMDNMPKHEYYLTLRQNRSSGVTNSRSGSLDLLDSRSSGTLLSKNYSSGIGTMKNNSILLEKPDKKFMHGTSRQGIPGVRCPEKLMLEFKPSNKKVACVVTLLDGRENTFEVDRESYGQHVFDAVCEQLYLEETEYFSLTFIENKRTEVWLSMDKRVKDQMPKTSKSCWYFQLRVRFYPYELDSIKDYLTQHLICTQVRQDLVNNTLPCSLYGRVSLAAAIIQSEGGDYDPQIHGTIEYIVDQPLAPAEMQNREFLLAIRDTHRTLAGLTPEEADRLFLDNARKLALYGMHFHNVKTSDEGLRMGVYHNGLALYREWLRVARYTWASMLKFSYKGKRFILVLRGLGSTGGDKKSAAARKASSPAAVNSGAGNGTGDVAMVKRGSAVSSGGAGGLGAQVQLQWKCEDEAAARRLYTDCLHHHQFFRLRESRAPVRPVLLPSYGTRKYTLGRHGEMTERFATLDPLRNSGEQYRSNLSNASSLLGGGGGGNQPLFNMHRASGMSNTRTSGTPSKHGNASLAITEEQLSPMQAAPEMSADVFRRNKSRPMPVSIEHGGSNVKASGGGGNHSIMRPDISRPEWCLSHGDRTDRAVLCADEGILYAPPGAGWQGARTTRGVRLDPSGLGVRQNFYYEATLLAEPELPAEIHSDPVVQESLRGLGAHPTTTGPLLRVGWSTQSASLLVGEDHEGFAFGCGSHGQDYCSRVSGAVAEDGGEHGVKVSHGVVELYGRDVRPGDVVGCEIDLNRGEMKWSLNGEQFDRAYTLPNALRSEAFFPAVTAMSGGVKMNFGQNPSRRFRYAPPPVSGVENAWCAVGAAPDSVPNSRPGWRMNAWDCTDTCELSPDGLMAQGKDFAMPGSWEAAARCNQGIQGPGNYYFEARMLEPKGGWRVGYSTENASLQLGSDQHGYGITVDPVLVDDCTQGLPLHVLCDGGKVYPCHYVTGDLVLLRANDVVGVLLDLPPSGAGVPGQLRFSVNGRPIQEVLSIKEQDLREPLYPATTLSHNTVHLNFGTRPFAFMPPTTENWSSLINAPTHQITLSKRRGNTRRLKGFSYLMEPQQLDTVMLNNTNLEMAPHVIRPQSGALQTPRRPESQELGAPLSPLRSKLDQDQASTPLSAELASRLQMRRSKIEAAENSANSEMMPPMESAAFFSQDPRLSVRSEDDSSTASTPRPLVQTAVYADVSKGVGRMAMPPSHKIHFPPPPPSSNGVNGHAKSQEALELRVNGHGTGVITESILEEETPSAAMNGTGASYRFTKTVVDVACDKWDLELDAAIRAVMDLPHADAEVSTVLERVQIHALQR